MGTRNLTCVIVGGEMVVAQYGQWDGHPSGQGAAVLDFLTKQMNKDLFLAKLDNCRFGSNKEIGKLWKECGADESGFVNMDISNKFKSKYPYLNRDMGARILEYIQTSDIELMLGDDSQFASDGLFCEWAYLIDFDKNVLNVYSGFHEGNEVKEEFRFPGNDGKGTGENAYSSIKLLKSYSLDKLPTQEQFELDLDPEEPFDVEDVQTVLDHIRSAYNGDATINDSVCDYIEAHMDEFLKFVSVNN